MVRYGLFKQSKGRAAEVNVLSPDRVFGTNWTTIKYPHRKFKKHVMKPLASHVCPAPRRRWFVERGTRTSSLRRAVAEQPPVEPDLRDEVGDLQDTQEPQWQEEEGTVVHCGCATAEKWTWKQMARCWASHTEERPGMVRWDETWGATVVKFH